MPDEIEPLRRSVSEGSDRPPKALARKLLRATPETLDVIERVLDGQESDHTLTKKIDSLVRAQEDGRTRIEIRTVKPFVKPSISRRHSSSADVLLLNRKHNSTLEFAPPERQESLSDDELIRPRKRRKSCLRKLPTEISDDSSATRLKRRVSFLLQDGTKTFPVTQNSVREKTEQEVIRRASKLSLFETEGPIPSNPDDESSSLHSEHSSGSTRDKDKISPVTDRATDGSLSTRGWKSMKSRIVKHPIGKPIGNRRSSLAVENRSRAGSTVSEYLANRPIFRKNTISSFAEPRSSLSPLNTPRGSIRGLQRSRTSSAASEYSDADRPQSINRRMTYGSRATRANSLIVPQPGGVLSYRGSMRELLHRHADDQSECYSENSRKLPGPGCFLRNPTEATISTKSTRSTMTSDHTSEYSDADTSSIVTSRWNSRRESSVRLSRQDSELTERAQRQNSLGSLVSLTPNASVTLDTIDASSESVQPGRKSSASG